jgi:hypothetical protein
MKAIEQVLMGVPPPSEYVTNLPTVQVMAKISVPEGDQNAADSSMAEFVFVTYRIVFGI